MPLSLGAVAIIQHTYTQLFIHHMRQLVLSKYVCCADGRSYFLDGHWSSQEWNTTQIYYFCAYPLYRHHNIIIDGKCCGKTPHIRRWLALYGPDHMRKYHQTACQRHRILYWYWANFRRGLNLSCLVACVDCLCLCVLPKLWGLKMMSRHSPSLICWPSGAWLVRHNCSGRFLLR